MAGAQAIAEAAASSPLSADDPSSSSSSPTPLLLLGTLLLAILLSWAIPLLLEARREAKRLAEEEARALLAVRKKLDEPSPPPLAAAVAAAAPVLTPAAVDGDDADNEEHLQSRSADGDDSEKDAASLSESYDPAQARQLQLDAWERRKPPAKQAKPAKQPTATATTASSVPANPLSAGAVETAARFPFLREWAAEARAALREALKAQPPPSPELRRRLRRLLARVVERPHDPRFWTFQRGNPAFAALWGEGGGSGEAAAGPFRALLWKLGFKEETGREGQDEDYDRGEADDGVVVALEAAPTAAHLEVIRRLVAMLDDASGGAAASVYMPLPQPPPPMAAALPPHPDEGGLVCHVCGEGDLFVDRSTARPEVLWRASHRRAAVHCADCGGFVVCGGCYNGGQTGGPAHAGHRFLLLPPAEGWDAAAAAAVAEGGWGGSGGGGGGWRRSAPVPRDRRPGRGPWG